MSRLLSMRKGLAVVLALCTIAASAQTRDELTFDVASIKRNTSGEFPKYIPPAIRPGQFMVISMTMREIILFGYPLKTQPAVVVGLPAWAESDGYDVMATLKSTATREELQQMWRALLSDRLKLQTHYETRERAAYALVFARADKRFGPQLQPSVVDCANPPPVPANSLGSIDGRIRMLMQRCSVGYVGTAEAIGLYSGGTSLADFASALTGQARRPVLDRTGLTGLYAISLRFASDATPAPGGPNAVAPGDSPLLFTAIQEQLGLKLEPTTVDGQVLVVDHIERPTAN